MTILVGPENTALLKKFEYQCVLTSVLNIVCGEVRRLRPDSGGTEEIEEIFEIGRGGGNERVFEFASN